MEESIKKEYFDWLCRLVMNEPDIQSRSRLMGYLFHTAFTYRDIRDANREADGLDLRYRFCYEHQISMDDAGDLDRDPCSVLEMMAALCLRCEETVMRNSAFGDRTGVWFKEMLRNLDIDMPDEQFNRLYAEDNIRRFLDREYLPDGRGGLFALRGPDIPDMRKAEIWTQAMWWLDQKLNI